MAIRVYLRLNKLADAAVFKLNTYVLFSEILLYLISDINPLGTGEKSVGWPQKGQWEPTKI